MLKREAAAEEAERRARERAKRIEGVETKLAERDRIGELQAAIATADKLFRDLVRASREADEAWRFIDATFVMAKGGGAEIGATKRGWRLLIAMDCRYR